jgi:hypothetical protein
LGQPSFQPDISHEQVASAANTSLEQVIALGHEGEAMSIMAEGAVKESQTVTELAEAHYRQDNFFSYRLPRIEESPRSLLSQETKIDVR